MRNQKLRKMLIITMFSVIALALQFLEFPVIPMFPFLKLGFSDLPVLISMFMFGPFAGVLTAFLRSALHLFFTGLEPVNLIGDTAAFLATLTFVIPIYYIIKKNSSKKNTMISIFVGTISMTIFMSIANYFAITPLYLSVLHITEEMLLGASLTKYIAIGVIPFNLIKGIVVGVAFVFLYKKLLPWLEKKADLGSKS